MITKIAMVVLHCDHQTVNGQGLCFAQETFGGNPEFQIAWECATRAGWLVHGDLAFCPKHAEARRAG